MKEKLLRHGSLFSITILALLECILLFLPEMLIRPFSYLLLLAFIVVVITIQYDALHRRLKGRHKGDYSS